MSELGEEIDGWLREAFGRLEALIGGGVDVEAGLEAITRSGRGPLIARGRHTDDCSPTSVVLVRDGDEWVVWGVVGTPGVRLSRADAVGLAEQLLAEDARDE